MSKKYIVESCPAITKKGRCKLGYEPEYGCFCEYVYNDCKIKKAVNKLLYGHTPNTYTKGDPVYLNFNERCIMARDILQLLDVQEVQ